MDYSRMLIFWASAVLLLSHGSESQGHSASSESELDLEEGASSSNGAAEDGREGRILGPRLISHVQLQNSLAHNPVPQPHLQPPKSPQTAVSPADALPAIPVTFSDANYGHNPVNVYPVQLPPLHPVVASLDKNENAAQSGVITGYPVIVHIPEQHAPIAIYRGQFPAFIERILNRIQNRYSVYNPPEYFENRPRPESDLQPPEPPLCVETPEGDGKQEAPPPQEGYAYAPPCPSSAVTTQEAVTAIEDAVADADEEPKPAADTNTNYQVFNGTIILINCTDLHPEPQVTTPTTRLSSTSTPYVYPAPTTTTTTTTPPRASDFYYYEPPVAPPQEGELFIIPEKPSSTPTQPPPPPPPSPSPSPPPNTYLPPTTTTTTTTTTTPAPTTTTTTTTPAPSYLPPETPKPSTPVPSYLPPETPTPSTPSTPSTPAPSYLPPETPTPSTPAPSYLPPTTPKPTARPLFVLPDPAPIYLPPKLVASSYLPPPPPTSTREPLAFAVSAGKGPMAQQPNININIHGYQHTNQLQPLLPFPLRFLQFKKLLLAKLLNLN